MLGFGSCPSSHCTSYSRRPFVNRALPSCGPKWVGQRCIPSHLHQRREGEVGSSPDEQEWEGTAWGGMAGVCTILVYAEPWGLFSKLVSAKKGDWKAISGWKASLSGMVSGLHALALYSEAINFKALWSLALRHTQKMNSSQAVSYLDRDPTLILMDTIEPRLAVCVKSPVTFGCLNKECVN